MNDEQYFLANAYLDGELTDAERRIAEADPEVMAEVEQLRALQATIRDVPAPSAAAKDAAIGAALAEFGVGGTATGPASGDDAEPAAAVPFRPRPASARYLAVAAAVVAVAGLGIIVSRANRGGDADDATASKEPTAELTAEDTADRGALTESVESGDAGAELAASADDGADTAGGGDTATAMVEEDAADEMRVESTSAEMTADMSEEAAEGAADADVAATEAAPSSQQRWVVGLEFDPDDPIRDERELGIYGVHLLDERAADRLPPSPNTRCGVDDEILDTATVIVDDEPTNVFISVIEADGLVFARDTDTCAVLLVGSIFVS